MIISSTVNMIISYNFFLIMSLDSGIFTEGFEVTKVIPIFKTGDKFHSDSFRRISLVPCSVKCLRFAFKSNCTNTNNLLTVISFVRNSLSSCLA